MGLIAPSILQLAKSFSDTHFATTSDSGEDIPGFDNISAWFPNLMFYLLHSMARTVSFAVISLQFPHYACVTFVVKAMAKIAIAGLFAVRKPSGIIVRATEIYAFALVTRKLNYKVSVIKLG